MHLIITGATGLVGSAALQHMLTLDTVTKISILSRRPVPLADGHAKAQTIIHKDYNTYSPELLERLKGAEGCVWAQGVSSNDVSREEYEKITVDYPLAAAKAFTGLHDPFKFVYVSGEGATHTPSFTTPFFGRIKGLAEAALLAHHKSAPSFLPYSARPAYVDVSGHSAIAGFVPKKTFLKRSLEGVVGPPLRMFQGMVSPTEELGRVLVELAMGEGKAFERGEKGVEEEGRVLGNVWLRKLGGN